MKRNFERIIGDVLCWSDSSEGKFSEYTAAELTQKLVEADEAKHQANIKLLRFALAEARKCCRDFALSELRAEMARINLSEYRPHEVDMDSDDPRVSDYHPKMLDSNYARATAFMMITCGEKVGEIDPEALCTRWNHESERICRDG